MIEETTTLRAGLIKRIHVDQHRIKADTKEGTISAVVTVQAQGGPYKGHSVKINGPSEVIYSSPLSCGARVWMETKAEVVVLNFDCPVCEDVRLVETSDEIPRVIDCPECAVTPV